MLPHNVAAFGGHKVRPTLRKQPDTFNFGGIVGFVLTPAGRPGRPWQRALTRAHLEDAIRKRRLPQKVIVRACIFWDWFVRGAKSRFIAKPSDKRIPGTLAGLKETGFQRLQRRIRKPDVELTPRGHSSWKTA